jgi:hypothetical protein
MPLQSASLTRDGLNLLEANGRFLTMAAPETAKFRRSRQAAAVSTIVSPSGAIATLNPAARAIMPA